MVGNKFVNCIAFLIMAFISILISADVAFAQVSPPPQLPEGSANAPIGADGGLNLDMKLDDLAKQNVLVPGLSTEVSTVDRQKSTIGRSPNAVFVITEEMIKRSGARNIPEVLRMAPGIDVARVNSQTWAISARGFNNIFSNKLLVQIDGRVIYNGTFGGVYWNQQSVVLPDVERIEIIRGPGTTMWGSNAVNGVINIITKNTNETQGGLVQSGGGDQERDFNTVRYGGIAGDNVTWRVYGQEFNRNQGGGDTGLKDTWGAKQGGFRMDYTPTKEDTFTLQGDLIDGAGAVRYNVATDTTPYDAAINTTAQFPAGNLLLRYDHVIDQDTSWQILTYYDHFTQNNVPVLDQSLNTWNIDVQYQFMPVEGHHFITGANYRRSQDDFTNSFSVGFEPPQFLTEWSGFFIQDTMTLVDDRWYFTLGTRLENNTFGNFQVEPTARLLFLPTVRQSAWVAVSRAVRNPTRSDNGVNYNAHIGGPGVPMFVNVLGNENIEPENMLSYEIGYRAAISDAVTWDIAGYINDYHKLVGLGPLGAPVFTPPGLFLPALQSNNLRAQSYGFETTLTVQLNNYWRLFGSYGLFEINAEGDDPVSVVNIEGMSPNNQAYLKSSWDLYQNVQFDLIGRYVDRLTALNVPKYIEMDARIGWQARKNLEFSFVGQNLLDNHHLEFRDVITGQTTTEVSRGWYAMMTWTF